MKVVLDANVIISGLLFPGGAPDRIVRAAVTGRLSNATSPDLLTELRRVLEKKFSLTEEKLSQLLRLIAQSSELVYPIERIDAITADSSDNRVLECAETAKVDLIVTGDERHLLKLKSWKEIRIVAPHIFVKEVDLL